MVPSQILVYVKGRSHTTLPIISHLLTFVKEFHSEIMENLHTVDISSTTYLLRLVNIVCERPLRLFCLVTQNNSILTVHTVCTLKKCTSSSSSTYHCINLVLSIYLFLHPYCSSRKVVVTQSLSVVGLRKIQLRSSKSLHISRSTYKSSHVVTSLNLVL